MTSFLCGATGAPPGFHRETAPELSPEVTIHSLEGPEDPGHHESFRHHGRSWPLAAQPHRCGRLGSGGQTLRLLVD